MLVYLPALPFEIHIWLCTRIGRLLAQVEGRHILYLSTTWGSHFCKCHGHWLLFAPYLFNLYQLRTTIHFNYNILYIASNFLSEGGWHFGSKPDLFANCLRWLTHVVIGQQSRGNTEGLSHLYEFSIVVRIPRSGPSMLWDVHTKIHTNHCMTNKSVPWNSALEPQQLWAIMKANDVSCWAKP
jgi:hypothetical protein